MQQAVPRALALRGHTQQLANRPHLFDSIDFKIEPKPMDHQYESHSYGTALSGVQFNMHTYQLVDYDAERQYIYFL
jgi:hypothetical protein